MVDQFSMIRLWVYRFKYPTKLHCVAVLTTDKPIVCVCCVCVHVRVCLCMFVAIACTCFVFYYNGENSHKHMTTFDVCT